MAAVARISPLEVALSDVCFCHFPVEPTALTRRLPEWLTVETIDGDAWVSAIPHTVAGVESFGLDLTRPADAVNVRTYVRGPNARRGLYFHALYTEDSFTSETASRVLRLPYRRGDLDSSRESARTRWRTLETGSECVFDVRYTVDDGDARTAPPDSLAHFLIERDRYFTSGTLGVSLSGSVGRDPWLLKSVDASVAGDLLSNLGLPPATGPPLVHYSSGTTMAVEPPLPLSVA